MRRTSDRYHRGRTPTHLRTRLTLESLDGRHAPSSLLSDLGAEPDTSPAVLVGDESGGDTSGEAAADPAATGTATAPVAPPRTEDAGTRTSETANPVYLTAPANAAPVVRNFMGVEVGGGLWRFTGDVADESPTGLTIRFGGEPASLEGKTTPTDANGHFDVVFILKTDGSDNGTASAETTDPQGLDSNVAVYGIHPG